MIFRKLRRFILAVGALAAVMVFYAQYAGGYKATRTEQSLTGPADTKIELTGQSVGGMGAHVGAASSGGKAGGGSKSGSGGGDSGASGGAAEEEKKGGDLGVPSLADCHGVFVRGRYDPVNIGKFSCNGPVCRTCTGVTPANACTAFCLTTKENKWGAEGLPNEKTFSKAEMQSYSSLFSQFGFTIPNSCFCRRSMFTSASDYGMGYGGGSCRNCVAGPPDPSDGEYFSACKTADWCDENAQ